MEKEKTYDNLGLPDDTAKKRRAKQFKISFIQKIKSFFLRSKK